MSKNISNSISERELIERSVSDDQQAQEALYRKYADKMFTVCLIYTTDEDDACDILQESFIKVFRNLHRFNYEGSFEGWIRKIVVNSALELYRKNAREADNKNSYETWLEPRVEGVLDALNVQDIIKLVNELPSQAAMVLKLFAVEGYAHHEIAQMMGVSVGTSKSQLNRARALLKEAINKLNG